MHVILKAENLSKQYRLGTVGTGTLSHDLNRWWHRVRGKEDPYLKVSGVNDRTSKANEDYVWALRNINFEVKQGEVLGIIGKNGAGKSTLLKILSRVTAPTTGSIKTKGRIASLLEVGTGFHPELTGRENIYLNGAVLGMTKSEIRSKIDEIIDFSGCEKYINTPVKRYSSGMRVRLGFAVAAHLEPEILVVDEVLAVGDAEFQKKAIGKMQDLSTGEGRTVLFVSHNMASIQSLCTKAVLLEKGENIFEGLPQDVVAHYLAYKKYTLKSVVLVGKQHRRNLIPSELRLQKISVSNYNPFVREDLHFQIQFIQEKNMEQKICLTGSICYYDDSRVGSFFTESFHPKKGKNKIDLTIPHHNLAPGSYYLNIAISTGEVQKDNLKMLDHAYEVIFFDVKQEKEGGEYMTEWNSGWGNSFLISEIKIVNE